MMWLWIFLALIVGWYWGYHQAEDAIKRKLEEAGLDPRDFV